MAKHDIVTLRDLPGKPGVTRAEYADSRTAALRIARIGKAVTSAGSCGAINVWRDRANKLRAEFMRYTVVQSSVTVPTLTDLRLWLAKWWPLMHESADAKEK